MKEFKYVVTDPEGIHARPAGMLVKGSKKICIGMHHHKRWKNEKTDSADDADVTWCKAGRYRNRCSKRRGRRCSD